VPGTFAPQKGLELEQTGFDKQANMVYYISTIVLFLSEFMINLNRGIEVAQGEQR